MYNDICFKAEIGTLFPNIDLRSYYTKAEIGYLVNELSTLVVNAYNKSEIDTFFNRLQ